MSKSLIGSMSAISSIVLLLLVTTVTASEQPDLALDGYYKLLKELKDHPTAGKGVKLMWDITEAFITYLCDLGDVECKALKEYVEEYKLEKEENALKGVNENALKAVKDGLLADADKIHARTHKSFMKVDAIRIALIDIICDHEPTECKFWT
jgi:hypothetical protein